MASSGLTVPAGEKKGLRRSRFLGSTTAFAVRRKDGGNLDHAGNKRTNRFLVTALEKLRRAIDVGGAKAVDSQQNLDSFPPQSRPEGNDRPDSLKNHGKKDFEKTGPDLF